MIRLAIITLFVLWLPLLVGGDVSLSADIDEPVGCGFEPWPPCEVRR
jgi:hypothetical protein